MNRYPFDFPLAHIWNAEDLAVAFDAVWRVGAEDATLAP
jgi:hypothetical protein